MIPADQILEKALQANQESEQVDFKASLDIRVRGELLEVVKDIIAMANSGGGVLLVGLNDDGTPSGHNVSSLLTFDPAKVTDQIFSATGRHFSSFTIRAAQKVGQPIAAILVGGVPVPLVIVSVGNYQDLHSGKQKTAFAQGVVYFRHGAKSEPGTTEDLERCLKREIEAAREAWLGNVRQVLEAPLGSRIVVLPPGQSASAEGFAVRVVDNPDAPVVRLHEQDWRDQYPYSFKRLTHTMRDRYIDFKENTEYHEIRRSLESDPKYCSTRLLDPDSPRNGWKRYYSPAVLEEFDKRYTLRTDD